MKGKVVITGAGLVGALLSIFLVKKGYRVLVFEKRPDLRSGEGGGGRSINLALSDRGLKALDQVGLMEKILEEVIPMKGRMVHEPEGNQNLQPYGNLGQVINSISRENLNILLLNEAERLGVKFKFNASCEAALFDAGQMIISGPDGEKETIGADLFIGADGAFSALRSSMQKTDRFDYTQQYLAHGYKELTIPPVNHDFALEPNALHIWPRKSYMLIALPNLDKSFTCTLFFPFEGKPSFNELSTKAKVRDFFNEVFPDVSPLIPGLEQEFFHNPLSSLVTIRCYPWVKGRFLLIGDAAHAIVPFYGQGMNAGFEDCTVLVETMDKFDSDWDSVLPAFQEIRKKDADAIADLALRNFIEMRDKVADKDFIRRKAIEKELHERFGDQWLPLYSMVTFSHLPYSEALARGRAQDEIMSDLLTSDCDKIDFDLVLSKYRQLVAQ